MVDDGGAMGASKAPMLRGIEQDLDAGLVRGGWIERAEVVEMWGMSVDS